MTIYDYVWVCMTLYDCLWPCMTMTIYDYVSLCMTMYNAWLCITMYVFVRLCMTMSLCTFKSQSLSPHSHVISCLFLYFLSFNSAVSHRISKLKIKIIKYPRGAGNPFIISITTDLLFNDLKEKCTNWFGEKIILFWMGKGSRSHKTAVG